MGGLEISPRWPAACGSMSEKILCIFHVFEHIFFYILDFFDGIASCTVEFINLIPGCLSCFCTNLAEPSF